MNLQEARCAAQQCKHPDQVTLWVGVRWCYQSLHNPVTNSVIEAGFLAETLRNVAFDTNSNHFSVALLCSLGVVVLI